VVDVASHGGLVKPRRYADLNGRDQIDMSGSYRKSETARGGGGQRARERKCERARERESARERAKERARERARESARARERERESARERKRERARERESDRARERHQERARQYRVVDVASHDGLVKPRRYADLNEAVVDGKCVANFQGMLPHRDSILKGVHF